MQFINFPPAKIGTKVQENVTPLLPETLAPRNNAVTDKPSHDVHCSTCGKPETWACTCPKLAENEQEAQRMAYAGRSWPALKEGKTFDSERLATSPLFERSLFD